MRAQIPIACVRIRMTNRDNVVTYHFSHDGGKNWTLHDHRMEISGLHHSMFGDFVSLHIGIYSAGEGSIRLRDFHYRAL